MSLCDTCPRPGACCREFHITGEGGLAPSWWNSQGIGGPIAYAIEHKLPFLPVNPCSEGVGDNGDKYQSWTFRCSNLLANGRCGDYENRPALCRSYEPMQDRLCALHGGNLLESK